MNRTLQSTISVLVIAGVGIPLWYFVVARRPDAPPAPPREVGVLLVDAQRVERRDFPIEVSAFGSLLARRTALLAPEQSGRIEWVLPTWRPGAFVRAGDVLLRLDARVRELELERARSGSEAASFALTAAQREHVLAADVLDWAGESLAIAVREHERLQQLLGRERVSESQVDRARTLVVDAEVALEAARARRQTAEANEGAARSRGDEAETAVELAAEVLRRTELVAPFSGRLSGRAPSPGSFLAAGVPIAELLDLASLHLSASVHEDELGQLSEGMPAVVTLPSRPGLTARGRVRAIDPATDPITRNARVEVEVENVLATETEDLTQGLLAGLFAHARIDAGIRRDVLWVDRRHIVWEGGRAKGFVVHEGLSRSVLRELELGDAIGEGFAVESGLVEGELLVTGPLDRVRDGVTIRWEEAENER